MSRNAILVLVIGLALAGCRSKKTPEVEDDPKATKKAMEDYARAKMPVLDRAIVENDLKQIHLFLNIEYSSSQRWPKTADAAKELIKREPDARKLTSMIDDGTYVLMGNPPSGGILAYCTKETTVGFVLVDTGGQMSFAKADELKNLLAQQQGR